MLEEAGMERPIRPERRRWMKFEGSIRKFCDQSGMGWWMAAAQKREDWEAQLKEYLKHADDDVV